MRITAWKTRHGICTLMLTHYGYGEYGRRKCRYVLYGLYPGQEELQVLFGGSDFEHAHKEPEGIGAVEDLMGFLALKPGDTDDEYFERHEYTPRQMQFAQEEAEELQLAVMDWYEESQKPQEEE